MRMFILLVLSFLSVLFIIGCTTSVELGETTGSSANEITYVSYADSTGIYSFERPQYWTDQSVDGVTEFDGPTNNGVYYTIIVMTKRGDFETKEDYVAYLESQWETAESYAKLSLGTTTVDGKEAAEIVVTYSYQGHQYKTRQAVLELENGHLIRIAYTGPEEGFADYMPVMDKALETFNVLD
ncbi:hypothetical protein HY497_02000 [Candidatus Woesearchaeota archaeon]|nr:hypothetical protein [Candidatus Woesearchaeota archaeon]